MEKKLPEKWIEVELIHILKRFENGRRPKGGVQGILEGIPSIGGEHLDSNGGFKFEKIKYIPEKFANTITRGRIHKNDILIVKDGATTGKTSFVDERFPFDLAFVNEHVFICDTHTCVNSKSIFYYLFSKEGNNRILENFTGSAQGGINQKFASNTLIPLPPRAEQDRIVAKLDTLFGQLEQINKSLEHIPTLLKNFRQQVLTQAVTGKLIGKSNFTTLGKLDIKIKTGPFGSALHKSEYIENGIPIINPSHIIKGEIIPNESITVSLSKSKELERWVLKNNDVILGRRGEMGRCSLYKEEDGKMICGTGSLILQGNNKISPIFLDFYLRSSFCIKYLESNSVGSTMINLNQKIINSLPFPKITREDQEKSVKHLNNLFTKADAIEAHYEALKTKIEDLPQAILHKAFKGELVPQLESDGDARELLRDIERVKKKLKLKKK